MVICDFEGEAFDGDDHGVCHGNCYGHGRDSVDGEHGDGEGHDAGDGGVDVGFQ